MQGPEVRLLNSLREAQVVSSSVTWLTNGNGQDTWMGDHVLQEGASSFRD